MLTPVKSIVVVCSRDYLFPGGAFKKEQKKKTMTRSNTVNEKHYFHLGDWDGLTQNIFRDFLKERKKGLRLIEAKQNLELEQAQSPEMTVYFL